MAIISKNIGQFWVIKHKPTGWYMPELKKGMGGYTGHTPVDITSGEGTPRLFTTPRGAKNALTLWLKGRTTVTVSQTTCGLFDESLEEDFKTTPVPGRVASDMGIERVVLSTEQIV